MKQKKNKNKNNNNNDSRKKNKNKKKKEAQKKFPLKLRPPHFTVRFTRSRQPRSRLPRDAVLLASPRLCKRPHQRICRKSSRDSNYSVCGILCV